MWVCAGCVRALVAPREEAAAGEADGGGSARATRQSAGRGAGHRSPRPRSTLESTDEPGDGGAEGAGGRGGRRRAAAGAIPSRASRTPPTPRIRHAAGRSDVARVARAGATMRWGARAAADEPARRRTGRAGAGSDRAPPAPARANQRRLHATVSPWWRLGGLVSRRGARSGSEPCRARCSSRRHTPSPAAGRRSRPSRCGA